MKNRIITSILGLLLMAGCSGEQNEPDAYGTFEATEITVSSLANGRIVQLNVEEGQTIDSGVVTGIIDTTDLSLKILQLEQQSNATGSRLDDLRAQIAVQEQNKANLVVEKNRVTNMLKDGAATRKQLDDINAAISVIDKQISSIESQFRGINDQTGSIGAQIAQLKEAIRNARVVNPVKGTVLTKFAETNEVAAFGKPLYRVADLSVMELRVYVTGTQLPQIRIGQTVKVAYDKDEKNNSITEGVISWISETAEFTPKTIQTKEERINLVYAVKVKVKNNGDLKIGMPGEVGW